MQPCKWLKAAGWYQHLGVGFHDKNRQHGESFKYFYLKKKKKMHSNSKHEGALICWKTNRLCQKLNLVLSDSLSESSDVTKGASGELAKLSRSLRQKGK